MLTSNITFETLPQAMGELLNKVEDLKQMFLATSKEYQPEADQLLTIQQAAEFLNLSVPTLYGYVHHSAIPVCKRLGTKRLYFSKQELTDWVKAGRKKTVAEIEAEADAYLKKK